MSDRVSTTLRSLRDDGRSGLIPYVVAGDPNRADSIAIVKGLARAGASVIELGIPWSDPIADGPANQAAMQRSLEAGTTTLGTLEMVAELRKEIDTPIVLMTYANPIFRMGYGRFIEQAVSAGVDGLLVTDVPIEEAAPIEGPAAAHGLEMIFLHTPTTDDERARKIMTHVTGFLYVVARLGVTGGSGTSLDELQHRIQRLRTPDLNPAAAPLAVGFGISTRKDVQAVQSLADGVVVGSVFSRAIGKAVADDADPSARVEQLARELLGENA